MSIQWGGAGHGDPAVGDLEPQRVAGPLHSGFAAQYALMPGRTVNAAAELISRTSHLRLAISGSAGVRREHGADEVDLDRAGQRVRRR